MVEKDAKLCRKVFKHEAMFVCFLQVSYLLLKNKSENTPKIRVTSKISK